MRSVKIYWAKVALVSACVATLTTVCTVYLTSGYSYTHLLHVLKHLHDREDISDSRFSQSEPEFPEGHWPPTPPSRQTTNEKNRVIMIRRPKGNDLSPKPIGWLGHMTPEQLGWSELPSRRPPQALLLGFGKCGTSALLEFLDLHPHIVSNDWEVDYFCDRMYPKYDLQWYVSRMPPSLDHQVTIEKSPCYIVEHDAHLRIHAMNSSMKLMVIVRDPVTRLLSEYGHYEATERYWGRPAKSLIDRIYDQKTHHFRTAQLLKVGDYTPHLKHLLNVFPRQQILIVDGDKLVNDPLSQTRLVENFLGLPNAITDQDIYFDKEKGFYCMKLKDAGQTRCLGKSKGRQHVEIDADLKRKLAQFFKPYNEQFFSLVGQRFDWLQ